MDLKTNFKNAKKAGTCLVMPGTLRFLACSLHRIRSKTKGEEKYNKYPKSLRKVREKKYCKYGFFINVGLLQFVDD